MVRKYPSWLYLCITQYSPAEALAKVMYVKICTTDLECALPNYNGKTLQLLSTT